MTELTRLREQCAKAAKAIGELEYVLWHRWVLYIIKALDSRLDRTDDQRQWMLEELVTELHERLNEGHW